MKFRCDACGYETHVRRRYRRCPTLDCGGLLRTWVWLNRIEWMEIRDYDAETVLFWRRSGNPA